MTNLLCDLGGTNCRLAINTSQATEPHNFCRFANQDFDNFAQLVSAYLQDLAVSEIDMIVVALAAPIEGDCVWLTNRDWKLDKKELQQTFGAKQVYFLNDFEALGYSLAMSSRLSTDLIVRGTKSEQPAPKLVVGAGTGLNMALHSLKGEVICAEAGHSSLVTETAFDRQLQDSFIERFGRCSMERILSGSGMVEIYKMLCYNSNQCPSLKTSHEIVQAGLLSADPIVTKSCEEFVRILGRAVGDLALLTLPLSGIYLTGGITRALEMFLSKPNGGFVRSFQDKGRMSTYMGRFPIYLLKDDHVALYGCAAFIGKRESASEVTSQF
ncbi:glucokinase [Cohaesibacter celericrescens]|uniref:glucokinase n=1 Tax=Cohaesibacter celericrescens TaxID=2067669 RepID=UPI0035648754